MTKRTVFKARLSGEQFKALWQEAQENIARLRACHGHRFPPLEADWQKKYRCEACGGEAKAEYVASYCEGFAAAGGDPRTICANIQERPA
ncbi:hypothetical protein [Methylosinus sp. Sm6]|uniref:hypothetical protein n=1 Tax=Methylosinus sp. Sm6 TaxID=2866948 RepID=UPI001C994EA1|nr:hypothetical protein [Methylosinus sp. Sm6]MBY6243865.1 hypothetical protein [Methylosinus sp. Sm6]